MRNFKARAAAAGLFAGLAVPDDSRAAIWFTDVSAAAGVGTGTYDSTTRHSLGVNWIDFNGDDWPDLFLVNGRDLTAHLYENDGDGTFTNRDAWLPAIPNGDMSQSLFADYDNDGDLDLYIWTDHTFLSFVVPNPLDGPPNLLLKNLWMENGGQPSAPLFVDVAAFAHVQDLSFPPVGSQPGLRAKAGAWLDYDRDGDQDLCIGHMVVGAGGHIANANRMYRNEGDGTFVYGTIASGLDPLNDPSKWRPTLAMIGAHLNQDLWPDLYVSNVADPAPYCDDQLFLNDGDGTFTDHALSASMPGVGDDSEADMGIDVADIDLDGDWDIYISDLYETTLDALPLGNVLYLGNGDGTFADNSAPAAGLASDNSWGVSFFDADQDGWEDLLVVTMVPIVDGPYFYRNEGGGVFSDVSATDGMSCGDARGSATADYDRDGDLDVAIVNSLGGPLQLFRNDTSAPGGWLQLKLVGTRSSRDAIGTVVHAETGGVTRMRQIKGGSSAHSQDDLVVHFGLGEATTVDVLRVLWLSGVVDSLTAVPVNQLVTIVEGSTVHANLRVELSVDDPAPWEGQTVTYTIVAANAGPAPATGVRVSDALPAGLSFRSSGPGYDSATGTWTVGALAPGAADTLAVLVDLEPGTGGSTITNVAHLLAVDQIDLDASDDSASVDVEVSATVSDAGAEIVPRSFALHGARPNPFRAWTRVELELPERTLALLTVVDVTGRHVRTLIDEDLGPGRYRSDWDGRDLRGKLVAPGVYFVRLETDSFLATRRAVRLH
ncbi:MAG: FG-GAP-like repeat-containing protein [Candidatus Eiseniibacteriota bacterium]